MTVNIMKVYTIYYISLYTASVSRLTLRAGKAVWLESGNETLKPIYHTSVRQNSIELVLPMPFCHL